MGQRFSSRRRTLGWGYLLEDVVSQSKWQTTPAPGFRTFPIIAVVMTAVSLDRFCWFLLSRRSLWGDRTFWALDQVRIPLPLTSVPTFPLSSHAGQDFIAWQNGSLLHWSGAREAAHRIIRNMLPRIELLHANLFSSRVLETLRSYSWYVCFRGLVLIKANSQSYLVD